MECLQTLVRKEKKNAFTDKIWILSCGVRGESIETGASIHEYDKCD